MKLKRWMDPRGALLALATAAVIIGASGTLSAADTAAPNPLLELTQLAEKGQFNQVLSLLKSQQPNHSKAGVAGLVEDLEHYQKSETERTSKRAEAYQKALDEMALQMKEVALEKALASAIDARGLSTDPKATLQEPSVKDLVEKSQTAAREAEGKSDWVEALSLYRSLDLLFDDPSLYRGDIKRIGQHLRLLRLYAPQQLEALYTARAKRLGKENPTQLHLDEETWQSKLKGIQVSMLRQALAQAARKHVGNGGYFPLIRGSLESLIVMAHTQGLEQTFPSFDDADKLEKFRSQLLHLRANLTQHGRALNFLDAATVIDKVIAVNQNTLQLPVEVLVFEMTEGATDTLDDFSSVIWPSDKEAFSRNTQGKFSGVGIQISLRDDRLIVVSPLEDTPAQRAGIKAGDIIATVDNRDTSTWSLDRAVREITGPEGTKVDIGVERPGRAGVIHFVLTRAEIVIESIRGWQRKAGGGWDYFIDPDHRIGYIRLSQFIPQSAADLDKALNEMEQDGPVNGLILDLRFNPGGLLSSSVEVSDRFIAEGPIVSTVGPDGKTTSQFRARPERSHAQFPMVVLVNEGSASASEILSGALQDYQRALILGTRSFGKGSVQDLFPLSGERAYLKLTTQYYKLPRGRIIHRLPESKNWGIQPDLLVDMTAQQMADALEFRQRVDILQVEADDEATEPQPVAEADDQKKDQETKTDQPPPTADQILSKSLDPQLEAGLLVLKTRLIAQQLVLAKGGDWKPANP